VEIRLVAALREGAFRAVVFGAGDWRLPTEHRPLPPPLRPGDEIRFGPGLAAIVAGVSPISPRLVDLRFDHRGDALWSRLYALGRPIQYSYAQAPLELWHVQVAYASRPWAAEMPSAGRPLRWEVLLALRKRGTRIVSLTHAAGISSTGDPLLDASLPLPERFEIPQATVDAVAYARARGGQVVAVGTSVARALEGAALQAGGSLCACAGETDLVIGPGYRPRVADGLLTGVHDKSASHYALLHAFAPEEVLARATAHSEEAGYLSHEFGDSWLIVGSASEPGR
jgi:S-adenosylmethionine:tRNA ribosyltransferase-isomerase